MLRRLVVVLLCAVLMVACADGCSVLQPGVRLLTVQYSADLLFLGPILKLLDSSSALPGTLTLTVSTSGSASFSPSSSAREYIG